MNYNVCVLRNFAIAAIVLHHSFCVMSGWPPHSPVLATLPSACVLFSSLLKIFGMAVFTFISGYVLSFQSRKPETFATFLRKKVLRVLWPMLCFALFYWALFPQYMLDVRIAPVEGTHLWYLPVIFLCIVTTASHFFTRHGWLVCAAVYGIMCVLGGVAYERTIHEFLTYYPTFYAGFWCAQTGFVERILEKTARKHQIALLGGVIAAILLGVGVIAVRFYLIQLLLAALCSYVVVLWAHGNRPLSRLFLTLSRQSFSIYLFHQFIINALLLSGLFDAQPWYVVVLSLFLPAFVLPWLIDVQVSIAYKKQVKPVKNV